MSSALSDAREPRSFLDLEIVTVARDVRTDDGALVRLGTRGTIVGVWAKGRSYEVEFEVPAGTATLSSDDLRAASAS